MIFSWAARGFHFSQSAFWFVTVKILALKREEAEAACRTRSREKGRLVWSEPSPTTHNGAENGQSVGCTRYGNKVVF